jgi:hypothetical protein
MRQGKHSDASMPAITMSETRVDVPRGLAHLVEARRLEVPLFLRAPDHRVQLDVRELLAFHHPHVGATFELSTCGASSCRFDGMRLRRGQVVRKGGRRRDDLVALVARFGIRQERHNAPPHQGIFGPVGCPGLVNRSATAVVNIEAATEGFVAGSSPVTPSTVAGNERGNVMTAIRASSSSSASRSGATVPAAWSWRI